MRWKARNMIEPKHNAMQVKKRFAFWLVLLDSNIYVWLSFYEVLQMYIITERPATIEGETYIFKSGKWVTISKRCK
jgi:hypothetical protein